MFTSVLVANRGEIAVRICKTLRKMGIRSVVVASIPDRRSLAVRTADDWVLLEGYSATESYLDVDAVIAAAKEKGCEAIHPGYGFLSERADFAERCAAEGIVFIGPTPEVLRALGNKSAARQLALANGVPVVPGWDGADDGATLIAKAEEIGFPVMIKARGGGGGRGMRPIHDTAELPDAIDSARREAQAAFGDPGLLLEKLVTNAHHVEVQVVADAHGNVIHLGERDCSVQRRRQKLIEESPSPIVDDALRAELTTAALKLARAVNYVNAGTFEFLVGAPALTPQPPLPTSRERGSTSSEPRLTRSGRAPAEETPGDRSSRPFYFLEVNPRLQVEHPVTEMVTGLDLVELQLRVAAGEQLPLTQEDVTFTGHAIEFRINAEDPWNDFRPSSGRITDLEVGGDVRFDAGFQAGDSVPTYYDSLVGKVVVHAPSRREALQHSEQTLAASQFWGLPFNAGLHKSIVASGEFAAGIVTVDWIEQSMDGLLTNTRLSALWAAAGAAVAQQGSAGFAGAVWAGAEQATIWLSDGNSTKAIRHTPRGGGGDVTVDGELFGYCTDPPDVVLWGGEVIGSRWPPGFDRPPSSAAALVADQTSSGLHQLARWFRIVPPPPLPRRAHAAAEGATAVTAPLAGTIATVRAAVGNEVEAGELLMTLEAMKMEHRITATAPGTVASVAVRTGDVVREGDVLVELA